MKLEEFSVVTELPPQEEETPLSTSPTVSLREFMGASPVKIDENPAAEPYKTPSPEDDFPPMFRSLMSGINRNINAPIARMGALAFDAYEAPLHAIDRLTGWKLGNKAPEFLANNPLALYYDKASEAWA
jgi:hypothetical protein